MIRQGILLFADVRQRAGLAERRVAGLSLLDRQIRTMARAGLEHITVFVPAGTRLRLEHSTQKLGLSLECLTWGETPTLPHEDEGYLVVLGEYVHHHASLTGLVAENLSDGEMVLQVGPPADKVGDYHPLTAGELPLSATADPDSVSAGAFLCSPAILPATDLAAAGQAPWLLLAQRAARGKIRLVQADSALWQQVLDRRGARRAKAMLFGQVTKKTSGVVSRHINARISIPTSKLLVETGLSPHAITVLLVMTTGLASAWLIAHPDSYARIATAGILWQFAAIFDRCDGEVARVKLCESKFGAWFDTVTDNIAYLCAYVCLVLGMSQLYPEARYYVYFGVSAVASLCLTLFIMYSYARKTGSGSLQHYLRALTQDLPESEKGWVQKLMEKYGFVAKRDFFSFFICIACLLDQLQAGYWFFIIIAHLAAGGVLLSQRKMLHDHQFSQSQKQPAILSATENGR